MYSTFVLFLIEALYMYYHYVKGRSEFPCMVMVVRRIRYTCIKLTDRHFFALSLSMWGHPIIILTSRTGSGLGCFRMLLPAYAIPCYRNKEPNITSL